jgi:hypothetical protein
MIMGRQNLDQLPGKLRSAIHANTKTKVVFQTGADDARAMSRELAIDDSDLRHLSSFEAGVRVGTPGGSSPPLTMMTNPPGKGYGRGNQVKYVSRQQFGRHVSDVEKDILSRRQAPDRPGRSRGIAEHEGWGEPSRRPVMAKEPDRPALVQI